MGTIEFKLVKVFHIEYYALWKGWWDIRSKFNLSTYKKYALLSINMAENWNWSTTSGVNIFPIEHTQIWKVYDIYRKVNFLP